MKDFLWLTPPIHFSTAKDPSTKTTFSLKEVTILTIKNTLTALKWSLWSIQIYSRSRIPLLNRFSNQLLITKRGLRAILECRQDILSITSMTGKDQACYPQMEEQLPQLPSDLLTDKHSSTFIRIKYSLMLNLLNPGFKNLLFSHQSCLNEKMEGIQEIW